MTLAVTLTVEELEALVERAVRDAIASRRDEIMRPVMTPQEVADELQCTLPDLSFYLEEMGLPVCHLVSTCLRFLRSDVNRWALDNPQRTVGRLPTRRPPITDRMRRTVMERDGLVCRICWGPVAEDDVHIDHIHPLSRGGQTVVDNLRVTHATCNMRRGAPENWTEA